MSIIGSWLRGANPSRTAIADENETLTYGELLSEARQLASVVSATHGSDRYLLIPAERSVRFVRMLAAVSLSGNVPVPIDPQAPDRAVEEIGRRCIHWARVDLNADFRAQPQIESVATTRAREELVLFTSGTSGTPKGVPMSSANLAHSAKAIASYLEYFRYPSAAVVLPLHYSYALLTQVLYMFFVGGRVRLFETFRNPIKFARAVEQEQLETFCGVPSTYHALCSLHRLAPLSMPRMRVVCSAGAAMDRTLMPMIREIFPNALFFDNYGMTEATPRISYLRADDPHFSEATCGKPIDGLEIRVLNENDFTEMGEGESGILAVRGPNVVRGYLNDTESTQAVFLPDGFALTGDVARIKGGYIYLEGRRDEILKVGGEKISPLEIERALAEHHDVAACAVAALSDPQRGQIPVAYVELIKPLDKRTITEFLGQRLSPVKVPVRYFEVRAFPLTSNGKLQRARLVPDDAELVVREIV